MNLDRSEMERRIKMSAEDKKEIRIRVIKNGIMVRDQSGVYAFESWDKAEPHVACHLAELKAMAERRARGG